MGIQSTRFITRADAEALLRDRRAREASIERLTDEEIEDELDETFYNYTIVEEGHPRLKDL